MSADSPLRELVWRRARARCEYCLMPSEVSELPFQVDHIIAQKHHGATAAGNLALSCFYCNTFKGPNIAGVDPASGMIVRLFHPRRDWWSAHFCWDGALLTGRTDIGRATIEVLRINDPEAIAVRLLLMESEDWPAKAGNGNHDWP